MVRNYSFKKPVFALLSVLIYMLFAFCGTSYAAFAPANDNVLIVSGSVQTDDDSAFFDSSQQKVYDNANLLTSQEESRLQQMCIEKALEAKIDLIIVTTNSTGKKSSMDYTEDFFMDHSFGYDKLHGDGVIMLINMGDREVWISTSGKGITYLSDTRIDNIITSITGKLSSGDYYDACVTFLTKTANYMTYLPSSADAKGSGNTMTVHDAASLSERLLYNWPVKLIISAVVAIIIVCILRSQNKTKMSVGSHSYMYNNQFRINMQHDHFLRTTRVRHEKSSGSSGGGGGSGGSSHSGSHGHSFGGGGGKF